MESLERIGESAKLITLSIKIIKLPLQALHLTIPSPIYYSLKRKSTAQRPQPGTFSALQQHINHCDLELDEILNVPDIKSISKTKHKDKVSIRHLIVSNLQ